MKNLRILNLNLSLLILLSAMIWAVPNFGADAKESGPGPRIRAATKRYTETQEDQSERAMAVRATAVREILAALAGLEPNEANEDVINRLAGKFLEKVERKSTREDNLAAVRIKLTGLAAAPAVVEEPKPAAAAAPAPKITPSPAAAPKQAPKITPPPAPAARSKPAAPAAPAAEAGFDPFAMPAPAAAVAGSKSAAPDIFGSGIAEPAAAPKPAAAAAGSRSTTEESKPAAPASDSRDAELARLAAALAALNTQVVELRAAQVATGQTHRAKIAEMQAEHAASLASLRSEKSAAEAATAAAEGARVRAAAELARVAAEKGAELLAASQRDSALRDEKAEVDQNLAGAHEAMGRIAESNSWYEARVNQLEQLLGASGVAVPEPATPKPDIAGE